MLVGVGPASDLLVAEFLPGVAPDPLQPGDAKAMPVMEREFMTSVVVPETKPEKKRNGKK